LSHVDAERRTFGEGDWVLSMRAYVEANAGQQEEAQRTLVRLQELSRRAHTDPQLFVLPYVGLGEKDKALDSLQLAYASHSNIITSLKVEPAFDPLRDEPRFQDLLRRVGLAQ